MKYGKLLQCPFCKSLFVREHTKPVNLMREGRWFVWCPNCKARGPESNNAMDASAYWNKAIIPEQKPNKYWVGDKVKVRVWKDYYGRYDYYEGVVDHLCRFEGDAETTVGIACYPVGYPDQPTYYFYNSELGDGIIVTKDIIELEKKHR